MLTVPPLLGSAGDADVIRAVDCLASRNGVDPNNITAVASGHMGLYYSGGKRTGWGNPMGDAMSGAPGGRGGMDPYAYQSVPFVGMACRDGHL
jgi:hypothetical protein